MTSKSDASVGMAPQATTRSVFNLPPRKEMSSKMNTLDGEAIKGHAIPMRLPCRTREIQAITHNNDYYGHYYGRYYDYYHDYDDYYGYYIPSGRS